MLAWSSNDTEERCPHAEGRIPSLLLVGCLPKLWSPPYWLYAFTLTPSFGTGDGGQRLDPTPVWPRYRLYHQSATECASQFTALDNLDPRLSLSCSSMIILNSEHDGTLTHRLMETVKCYRIISKTCLTLNSHSLEYEHKSHTNCKTVD